MAKEKASPNGQVNNALAEKLSQLPDLSGVYLMKDREGRVIYVGKATSLKSRVRSYFQARREGKTAALVEKIADLETIAVESPRDALILENILIKKYNPRYNIRLKDDKQYPFLQLTVNERFPRLLVARSAHDDGTRYFGPYTGTGSIREKQKVIQELFPLRSCNSRSWPSNHRACLNYHMGRCPAPCQGKITEEEYRDKVKEVALFLQGKTGEIKKKTERAMQEASRELRFEEAARLRDILRTLEEVKEQQVLDKSDRGGSFDVLAAAKEDDQAVIQVFFIRRGKVAGRDHFSLTNALEEGEKELLARFLLEYYGGGENLPARIFLSHLPDDSRLIEGILSEKAAHQVHIIQPQRGEKKRLVKLVGMNAALVLSQRLASRDKKLEEAARALEELRQVLGLKKTPARMECYDISHIQGSYTVGSMTVFIKGLAEPQYYRRFRIKSVQGVDDFASLQEVLRRRLERGLEERRQRKTPLDFGNLPDLLIIDGGKGQLSSVVEVLDELKLGETQIISLAKKEEEVFLPQEAEPLRLPLNSPALKLLQRIRDEAHRFALAYHRKLRSQGQTLSFLDGAPGIGPKRRERLLQTFGSLAKIRQASREELEHTPGMNKKTADILYGYLHADNEENAGDLS